MSVAEVTVRFAGTILDVAHVQLGGCYRIGTAPGVELPLELAGITVFPIVDATSGAFVVRRPAGTYATRNALPMHEPDARLATSDHLELWLGNVLVTVELVTLPAIMAKPAFDRRPAGYLAGSLAVHLVMWSVAIAFAAPLHVPKPRPRIQAHLRPVRVVVREPDRTPPKPPVTKVTTKAKTTTTTRAQAQAMVTTRPRATEDMFQAAAAAVEREPMRGPAILADLVGKMDVGNALAQIGPLYDPDAVHDGDFGKGLAFDPDTRPAFDTIKTGRYQTISSGAAAGAHYSIEAEHARVHVRLCEDDGCTADGALERQVIDYRLAYKLRQFAGCYQADAQTLTFELVIGTDGKVREAHGPGKVGNCVAKVASAVAFPAAPDETRVTYSVLFVPPT
jgi:hypothetical protein